MRKIILHMAITLDGYLSGPDGDLDWMHDEQAWDEDFLALIKQVDTAILGHGVYQDMENYWTSVVHDPSTSKQQAELAHEVQKLPKIVISKSEGNQTQLSWENTSLVPVKDRLPSYIEQLKQKPGRDLVLWGGIELAQTFVRLNLVDEYRLIVYPIVLGEGRPLFVNNKQKHIMKITKAELHHSGIVLLTYQPGH